MHASARLEREHFDRLAESVGEVGSYRTTAAGRLRMQRRGHMLAQALEGRQTPRLLELGAGAGAFTQFILEALPAAVVLACDISPKCIALAAARLRGDRPNLRLDVADCTQLAYADESFDCVCGCSILHHLPLEAALAECVRVLRPGGIAWFSEPNMLNPQIAIQKNVRFVGRWLGDTENETAYFRRGLARSFARAGLIGVEVRPFDFLHPHLPAGLAGPIDAAGRWLERIPLMREFSGSLEITARKAGLPDSGYDPKRSQ